jgi:hypothetical protein
MEGRVIMIGSCVGERAMTPNLLTPRVADVAKSELVVRREM